LATDTPPPTDTTAKILIWDIEASNLSADFGILLAFGYKWLGDAAATVWTLADYPRYKRDRTDDQQLVTAAYDVLARADMWVTYYGTNFDIKFMNARLLYHQHAVLPPIPHVDVYYQAKKLKLHSYRLGNVGEFLNLSVEKTPLSGPIWIRAIAGNKDALAYVREHCLKDVELLDQAYQRLRALTTRHPRVTLTLDPCRACGGPVVRRGYALVVRGERRRKIRVQCTVCGAWENRTTA
jgi:uncharacterized protein YprB with RNaseH-like and TPR domain